MKKMLWSVGASIMGLALIFAGGYGALAYYYSQGFCCGTWINGVYATGKSVYEINQELAAQNTYEKIIVRDKNGDAVVIHTADIGFNPDYTNELKAVQDKQVPLAWISYYFNPQYYTVSPEIKFDTVKVEEKLMEANFMQEGIYDVNNVAEIEYTEDGYVLCDNTVGLLVPKRAVAATVQGIANLDDIVELEETGCYDDLAMNAKTKEVYRLWDKINAFQSFNLTYEMGEEKELVDASVVSKWILKDENGEFVFDENDNLVLDETKVEEYALSLGEKYDTIGKPREFKTTSGEVVTIEFSNYGNDLDEKKETELLVEAFLNGDTGTSREPVYKKKAKHQGSDDIGGTYIEVDVTAQKMYFYKDYEKVLESDCVTGNMRRNFDTPAMVSAVYFMQKSRVLRGANYASFVYYWMAVYRGYGLHDATWRSEFGGDIYLTDGSHGCVNLPKDIAAQLYEYVEIGTPCVIYYR